MFVMNPYEYIMMEILLYSWQFPDLLFHISDVQKEEYEQLYVI